MNPQIRRVGLVIVLCFLVLAGQVTYLQLVRADELANDPANIRAFLRDANRPRGPIVTADGAVVAESEERTGGDLRFRRRYPLGPLFGHVSGFQSFVFGNTGVEATYHDELLGRTVELQRRAGLADFLAGQDVVGRVVLTLSRAAQELARDALGGQRGSVVVVDVRTGGIVAMYSNPAFDPEPIASLDAEEAVEARNALRDDPANPELARAYRERYPTGSAFKIVTAALALDEGLAEPSTVFPELTELPLPLTDRTISNFGGSRCGGTLVESFRRSCNTVFAQLGLDLGDDLAVGIERFGLNVDPPRIDVRPGAARSIGPLEGTFEQTAPTFAQAAIGQGAIAMTPLQLALATAAVANGGTLLEPRVVDRVETSDLQVAHRLDTRERGRAMSPATAAAVTDMMVEVVARGTGTRAQIPGVTVAGKTGTAQAPGGPPHAWFAAFAPAEAPAYAIAVLVERGGDAGDDATGGAVAAPVAATVLRGLLDG